MAKRRKAAARTPEIQRAVNAAQRRGVARRQTTPQPRSNTTALLVGGGAIVIVILLVVFGLPVLLDALQGGSTAGPVATRGSGPFEPPTATPLANPPAAPAGDGTTVTIETSLGNIVIDVYDQSAPVAAQNFVNLADEGFYNTLVFHRLVPGFVIQGGDPNGDGTGGPGYSIADEPVVGHYGRGIVAMARTSAANSAGSQFFIVLDDSAEPTLAAYNTYVIFGKVSAGMDVVDAIAARPNSGSPNNTALDPVAMDRVTVQRP
jgi:peptidyl-prolyl cis-trans isomerase B (cyclophilin B)